MHADARRIETGLGRLLRARVGVRAPRVGRWPPAVRAPRSTWAAASRRIRRRTDFPIFYVKRTVPID